MSSDVQDMLATRKQLEDEIATHAQAIIDLRGRLNTMTSIARLPPELLSEVFLHVVRDSYYTDLSPNYPPYGTARFYNWVKVSHVCRSWRAIALGTPRLWGHIILTKRPVVEDILARSKKAPLLVRACILSSTDERAQLLENVLQDSSRLQELRLSGPARLLQELCPKLTGPAGKLETLVLAENAAYSHAYTPNVGDTALSAALFEGQLPLLRSLEIRRLVFNWKNPVLSSTLTSLVLAGRFDSQSMLGSFDQLLVTLETMTHLESLEIEDAIPRLPSETVALPTPERKVALPRLRRIALTGQCLDCANLTQHLSLSPTARAALVGRGSNNSRELIRIMGEHIARYKPLLTARISSSYNAQLHLRGWRALVDPSAAPEPCIELRIDALSYPSLASHLVHDTKVLAQVRTLEIASQYTDWRWKVVFAGMPKLRTLSMSYNPGEEFISALSKVLRGKKGRSPSMILPDLRVVKFTQTRMCRGDYDEDEDGPDFLDRLEDWLIMRCNYNLPIDELYLAGCTNFTEDEMDRLVGLVPTLDWDGMVEFDSGSEEDEDEDEDEEDEYDDPYYDDMIDYDYDFDGGYDGDFFGFY
ncbi:hypothetical protein VTO73DRAFT_2532 [Trametes versicolor]